MAHDPAPDEANASELNLPRSEIVSPPQDPKIISDTLNSAMQSGSVASSRVVHTEGLTTDGFRYIHQQEQTKLHIGPLPDSQTLQELNAIYPGAAKIIFDEFKAQSAHRRELEKAVTATKNTLATRGQIIAGILGATGLIVGGVVASLGQGLIGFSTAILSVGTLAGLFIYGQESQKKELQKKEDLRQKIKRGMPIEDLEQADPADSQ